MLPRAAIAIAGVLIAAVCYAVAIHTAGAPAMLAGLGIGVGLAGVIVGAVGMAEERWGRRS